MKIRTISASEARKNFAEITDKAHFQNDKFIITKDNRPFAIIIGNEDFSFKQQKAKKRKRHKKQSLWELLTGITSDAPVPKDLSLNHDKYLADIIYETSFRGSNASYVKDKLRKNK